MKTLIPAIVAKLKADASIIAQFSSHIYQVWNPNDPGLLTTVNKFPFIGVTAGVVDRIHEGSQLLSEALRPKLWIYHQLYKQEGPLFQALLDFQEIVRAALEYDTDFAAFGYTGSDLIEAFCTQFGEPEPFTSPDHPMAARISLTMEYQRTTEEVLV